MATITIDIPDAQVQRVVTALCAKGDYDTYVKNGGTMTKNQFAKFMLADWVKRIVRLYEVQQSTASNPPPDPGAVDVT